MKKLLSFPLTMLLTLTLVFGNIVSVKAATTSYKAPKGATWTFKSGSVGPSQIQYSKVIYYTHAQIGDIVADRLDGAGTYVIQGVIGYAFGLVTPASYLYSVYGFVMATNDALDNSIIKDAYKRNLGLKYYEGYKWDAKGKCHDFKTSGYAVWTNAPTATSPSPTLTGSFSAGVK